MRIAVDATTLLLHSAGIRSHIHYWLSALIEQARDKGDAVLTYPLGLTPPAALHHEKSASSSAGTFFRLALVHFCNVRGNPALGLWASRADVFHASQHVSSAPKVRKLTATVFDLSCWTRPDTHTPANVAATRRYGERILKAADGLIANSENARADAIEILNIPGERIRVIYPGIPSAFFEVTAEDAGRMREKYQLRLPYLLFVGCIEPRKNVPALIHAHQNLPGSLMRDTQLVLAGSFGWHSEEVRAMISSARNIRHLGYVPESDLPGMVRGAAALVYPSFYEGFGLPVAQAMAAGTAVIASDRSCLPEVVGDAGLLIDPDSVDHLSSAIERVLTDSALAEELTLRGRSRARRFTWPVSAAESLSFFHDVADRR